MLQIVFAVLLTVSGQGSRLGDPIVTFDPQNWEVTHVTILRPAAAKRDSALTITHPMPLRRPWSAVPDLQSDAKWGWVGSTASPAGSFLQEFRILQLDNLIESDPIGGGYGYRWHLNGLMSSEVRFVSRFGISTTGRRLNDRFRVNFSVPVPETLQQSVLKIVRESPPSLVEGGKALAQSCLDEIDAVRLFSKWVKTNIGSKAPAPRKYELAAIWQARATNRRGQGMIFRALCASMGIPAREARGYYVSAGEIKNARNVAGRSWSEVWIRGAGWVEAESATEGDAFYIPAAYVQNGYWHHTWVDRVNVSLPKPTPELPDEVDDRITWHRIR